MTAPLVSLAIDPSRKKAGVRCGGWKTAEKPMGIHSRWNESVRQTSPTAERTHTVAS